MKELQGDKVLENITVLLILQCFGPRMRLLVEVGLKYNLEDELDVPENEVQTYQPKLLEFTP